MATHDNVAHRWAQDDASARPLTAQRMFFERGENRYQPEFGTGEGQVIFSHGTHWPLAAFQTTPAGERVVLVNVESYSVSTRQHLGRVFNALGSNAWTQGEEQARDHHGYRVFGVRWVHPSRVQGSMGHDIHARNVEWLIARAVEAFEAGNRRRSDTRRDRDMKRAASELRTLQSYSEAFGLAAVNTDLAAMAAQISSEREQRREAIAIEERARAEAQVKRLAEARANDAAAFAAWQADQPGTYCPLSYYRAEDGSAYVRRHRLDGVDTLQTSMGADCPWPHALAAYRIARRCRALGEAWETNGHTIKVGVYNVSRISKEGDLTAGCHLITWPHMLELAEREGVA